MLSKLFFLSSFSCPKLLRLRKVLVPGDPTDADPELSVERSSAASQLRWYNLEFKNQFNK